MLEILDEIRNKQANFSASQRLVAKYVLKNYTKIPFLSISTMAKEIGVSDNTVIKFCNNMGYSKFTEFKKILSDYARSELIMYNKISKGWESVPENEFFAQILQEDSTSIKSTLMDLENQRKLPKLVKMIENAKHIYIIGGRSSAVFATLFTNMLRYLGLSVYEINPNVGECLDYISMVKSDDLVIAFSISRYTSEIVDALSLLKKENILIALITDTGICPAQPYAELSFHCDVSSKGYFPCFSGCLSLINAVCRAMAVSHKTQALEHVHKLESQLIEQETFV